MKNLITIVLFLLLSGIFWQSALAQTSRRDSLQRIMIDSGTPPEQRKKVRDELLDLGDFAPTKVESQQDVMLRKSMQWFETTNLQQDSIVSKMIDLVLNDTTVNNNQKRQAIQILAKSRNPSAYAFLIENMDIEVSTLGSEDTDDVFWKATFKYLLEDATNNWGLFPIIMQHLSNQKVSMDDIIPLTIIIEKIVGDSSFLMALINLYEMKEVNDIFTENKKKIIHTLEDLH